MAGVELMLMDRLNAVPPPPPIKSRVVVSRLAKGETLIAGSAPSLKMVLEGEEVYKIDGRIHRVTPGQILLVDGGAAYEATIRGSATRGLCIHLPQFSTRGDEHQLPLGRAIMRGANTLAGGVDLLDLGNLLHRDTADSPRLSERIVATATMAMLGGREDALQQMRRLELKRPTARQDVMNRLEIARGHLHSTMDRAVSLAELANLAGISTFHFSRYFAAAFGAPPGAYHRSLRLNHARQLLRTRQVTATDAGEAIGYSEIAAFSNAFSREFGYPPSRA